ncbi:hypothetical protein [Henriciella aquimarina]|uniref:hypothetical protein n=1 Tax=Henriciella aquimarina TaxID=545261 RepID=UPI000A05B96A|nr:hypothetical protein [Henriciella aquimarina]
MGTVQLYRLMSGMKPLEDLPRRVDIDLYEPRNQPEKWTRADILSDLDIMTDAVPSISGNDAMQAAARLDLATTIGPASDWWLRPDDFEDGVSKYPRTGRIYTGLNETERTVAGIAANAPAMDWLLAALSLSAELHELYPALEPDWSRNDDHVYDHILRKAEAEAEPGPWLALAITASEPPRRLPSPLRESLSDLEQRVEDCTASPADYTVLASSVRLESQAWAPPKRLQQALLGEARRATMRSAGYRHDRYPFTTAYHREIGKIAALAPEPAAFALPLMLSAPSAEEAAAYAVRSSYIPYAPRRMGPYYVTRMLPVSTLEGIMPNMALARSIALGRTEDASRQLETFLKRYPEYRQNLNGLNGLPADVRLAVFALRTDCLSTRHESNCSLEDPKPRHLHRDLSQDWAWGAKIKFAFENWLYGTSYQVSRRAQRRRIDPDYILPRNSRSLTPAMPDTFPSPRATIRFGQQGIAGWAAWDEIGPLATESRMTRTVALTIIDWVDDKTDTRLKRWFNPHKDVMAEALHRTVYMLAHEPAGDIDGKPVAKRAFELLHYRFGKSDWAKQTRYWWEPDHRH